MFGLNMHGMAKCNKQYYKLNGAQYATLLHIDGTPHSFIYSLPAMFPTILNVLNMARGEA